jgi:Acetyltransferase (GNAT) domain
MTLRPECVDPLRDPRWSAFVARSPDASVFHHVGWLSLLREQYGYRILARCVTEGDRIVAGIPFAHVRSRLTGQRLVALPFSDVCPPVSDGDGGELALRTLAASITERYERDGIEVEVRGALGDLPARGKSFYHHRLGLTSDIEAVRAGFNSRVRRGVARAERDGVEVIRGTSLRELDAFYRLHLRTRRRLGVPTQPKRFIRRFASLFEHGLGFVLLSTWEGQPISGAVFLCFNGVLTYKYSASAPEALKQRPNHAMLMEAMRWGCEHGLHTLDFGRTDLDGEGLRAFKRGWGAAERQVSYVGLSRAQPALRSGVPGYLSKVISNSPPIAGRLVGEALYRHFG